ncbi:MAG: MscL family protein [Candidatus Nomurabacteria bacterium]|nr:MAG: MscL family protein [Candidatus Nomurabacteria bacterium]
MSNNKPSKREMVSAAKRHAANKARAAKDKRVVRGVNRQAVSFVDFIRDRGIVGMAIGLAIGTVASGTIKTLVESFITPLVRFIVGSHGRLEASYWHIELWGRKADLLWGAALSSLITLVATIFVVYVLVHMAGLDRIDKKKD